MVCKIERMRGLDSSHLQVKRIPDVGKRCLLTPEQVVIGFAAPHLDVHVPTKGRAVQRVEATLHEVVQAAKRRDLSLTKKHAIDSASKVRQGIRDSTEILVPEHEIRELFRDVITCRRQFEKDSEDQ